MSQGEEKESKRGGKGWEEEEGSRKHWAPLLLNPLLHVGSLRPPAGGWPQAGLGSARAPGSAGLL